MDTAPGGHQITEHTFGVDELFFSTTDRKGIIETSNSVFERISRYSHDELIGAPHNIIRHMDMPSGAFKLVWDEIMDGRPACAYVKNLAKDGKPYWVLATLMPVADKYLSVRLRPLVSELRELCERLYAQVVIEEHRLRVSGMSRSQVAEAGARMIAEALAELDIKGMAGLTATLLPAEMAARMSLSAGPPLRPQAEGPLRDILDAVSRLSTVTGRQVGELEAFAQLASKMKEAADATRAALHQLFSLSEESTEAARQVAAQSRVLVNTAIGLTEMVTRAEAAIVEACAALDSACVRLSRTRTQIALGRLHIDMVGNFTAELIDGREPDGAQEAIDLLCLALAEGNVQMADDVQALPAGLHTVAELVAAADEAISTFRRWAINFRNLISREGLWAELGHLTPLMDELLTTAFQPLSLLKETAQQCRLAGAPFNPEDVYADLDVIRRALARHTADPASSRMRAQPMGYPPAEPLGEQTPGPESGWPSMGGGGFRYVR